MRIPRVMLLVDADNVSANVLEQAIGMVLETHGAAHVRRAYCTPESAVKNATLFKELSLRPMVNLSTGKNATDIALAVDAMDLVMAERPDVAVIVSSDSDFAPLVLRLRENGCRVEGIGQLGKTSDASKGVYDSFVDLEHRRARPAPRTSARPAVAAAAIEPVAPPARSERAVNGPTAATRARRPRAASGAASPLAVDLELDLAAEPPRAETPAPAAARRAPPTRKRASATATAEASLPDDVQAILKAVPPLASGQPVALGVVAERLRAAGLLGKNAASTRLFSKHVRHFVLAPLKQPNTVQFIGPVQAA